MVMVAKAKEAGMADLMVLGEPEEARTAGGVAAKEAKIAGMVEKEAKTVGAAVAKVAKTAGGAVAKEARTAGVVLQEEVEARAMASGPVTVVVTGAGAPMEARA